MSWAFSINPEQLAKFVVAQQPQGVASAFLISPSAAGRDGRDGASPIPHDWSHVMSLELLKGGQLLALCLVLYSGLQKHQLSQDGLEEFLILERASCPLLSGSVGRQIPLFLYPLLHVTFYLFLPFHTLFLSSRPTIFQFPRRFFESSFS